MYKQPRLNQIKESEDLYAGIVKRSLVRENTEPFPFMSGFVDHLYAEIDDAPNVEFGQNDEADYKTALKITAFFNNEKDSVLSHAKWNLKDRWCKKMAIFSGRGIMKYFSDSDPQYRSNLSVVDHYDFHCEPGGGGHLEDHLFCGEEGIFKTKEELLSGSKENFYDTIQVAKITMNTPANEYKENEDEANNRLNRHRGMGLDPQSNNYTGQELYKCVEWYLTVQGVRWYVLLDYRSQSWLRVKALRDIFTVIDSTGDALYPYVSFATHEDPRVFWSKAPCDDARPIAKMVNKLLNQEVYNREKKNTGVRLYDPTMIEDIDALADQRPDGLIPVNTVNGKRALSGALFPVATGDITGTLDLVSFLDSFHGQKSGNTASSEGQTGNDKKVGIFFGELKQVEKRLSVYNKSYQEMWSEIGLRFVLGLDENLRGEMPIKLIGPSGVEWETLTRADLKRSRPLSINIKGGTEEAEKDEILAQKKSAALALVQTVNPAWKDRQALKNAGFSDEDLKEAFSPLDASNRELMSEAAQAIEDFEEGRTPRLNRGANTAFMQKIVDFANDLNLNDKQKEMELATKLYDYAIAHAQIAADNENRQMINLVKQKAMAALGAPGTGAPAGPGAPGAGVSNALLNTTINSATPAAPAKPALATPSPVPQAVSTPM